jgi:hypothetical protein
MDTLTRQARDHDGAAELLPRAQSALAALGPEDATLSIAQLAALDRFHTRGLAATAELAAAAGLAAGFPAMTGDLARNLREGRAGVLAAIAAR